MTARFLVNTFPLLSVCLTAGFVSLAAQGQAPPPPPPPPVPGPMRGTSAIAVHVVSDSTGRPIRGASVFVILISDEATYTKNTLTDRDGRALLLGLAKGRARISASHQAYLTTTFGQERPGDSGTFMPIGEGQTNANVTLRMKRGGALGGVVTSDAGEPMAGLQVHAFRRGFTGGRQLFAVAGVDVTDDRGAYRIAGLQPGEYLVGVVPRYREDPARDTASPQSSDMAEPPADPLTLPEQTAFLTLQSGRTVALDDATPIPAATQTDGVFLGYEPTFYPGTSSAEAAIIKIGPAERREAIDFALPTTAVVRVAGVAVPDAGSLQYAMAVLMPAPVNDRIVEFDRYLSFVNASGVFSFPFVPRGEYRLEIRGTVVTPESSPLNGHWGSLVVGVGDRPVQDLSVRLRRGGITMSGLVTYASGYVESAVRNLSGVQLQLTLQPPSAALGALTAGFQLRADGRFSFEDVMPGRYTLSVSGLPYGWFASSATVNGRDAFDFGLNIEPGQDLEHVVVTVTDRMADLSGVLRDSSDKPATSGYVVVFPADRTYWTGSSRRVQASRPDSDGRFAFLRTLPPGDYLLVAADLEPGSWQDPTVLAALEPRAVRVPLRGNEKVVRDVRR